MISDSNEENRPVLRLVPRPDRAAIGRETASEHRFPPIVQVLNPTLPHIQERMQGIATMAFRRGLDSKAICSELASYVQTSGYEATIGVQDVKTDQMPSFQDGTVVCTIMLVDLNPATSALRLCKSIAADG